MTDYNFYKESYLLEKEAVIDATSFLFYERKACQEVRRYTFGNINESEAIPEVVKQCVCEVAEYIYSCDKNKQSDNIATEKVGEHSVSYVSGQTVAQIKQNIIKGIIYGWLAETGLMYCGVM